MSNPKSDASWWLTNEPSGKCDVLYASVSAKQSTLVRHSFEHPLSLFSLQWRPLPHQPRIVEFSVTNWVDLNAATLKIEPQVQNLAGLFSFTVDLTSGALLTVLAGHTVEERFRQFYESVAKLKTKLTRQDILAHYVQYAQNAAQQKAQELWRLLIGLWHPRLAQDFKFEKVSETKIDGVQLNTQTVTRNSTDTATFAQAFSRIAQSICWDFEDIDPVVAIDRYTCMPDRGQDEPLRGVVNDFTSQLTPDQFDLFTLQEEFNRSLTKFCLKHHPSKFRKRRWEAMRCTSPIYLLDENAISFDGVSDSRTYHTQYFSDGRPVMVKLERDQESALNLDQRTLFSHRTHHSCAWMLWYDSPYTAENDTTRLSLKDLHKGFVKAKKELDGRFSNLFKLPPHMQVRLQRAFTFLDQERDGTLDHNELRNVLSRTHGRLVSEDEVDRAMKELDPSGNGKIEPSEFLKYMSERGTLQGALLPINLLDAMCRAGFEVKRRKTKGPHSGADPATWLTCWIELDPFGQVLAVYDDEVIGSFDEKLKRAHLKSTVDLKERVSSRAQYSADYHIIVIAKKNSTSKPLNLALSPKMATQLLQLLQRCVSNFSSFELEAKPIVQDLLVEAALPALASLAD